MGEMKSQGGSQRKKQGWGRRGGKDRERKCMQVINWFYVLKTRGSRNQVNNMNHKTNE